MQAIYPLVPLFGNQALGIALFSYNGTLHWGFNADWDAVPDLHDLVEHVQREYRALRDLLESIVVESPRRTIPKAGTRRVAGRAAPGTANVPRCGAESNVGVTRFSGWRGREFRGMKES